MREGGEDSRWQALLDVARLVSSSLDLNVVLDSILAAIKPVMPFESAAILLPDHEQRALYVAGAAGADAERLRRELTVPYGAGVTGKVFLTGAPMIVQDAGTFPGFVDSGIAGIRSEIAVPLKRGEETIGVMAIDRAEPHAFTMEDLGVLALFAAQVAIAIEYENLRTDAITDPLTGVYNRRYLQERLAEERSRAARTHHPLVALLLDIDKFKRINDRFGHEIGDAVLADIASVIRDVVRAEDVVARLGGEEFCVLLPEIPAEDAERVAERLRSKVEAYRCATAPDLGGVTASIGVAVLEAGEQDGELLARADQAMYHGKALGGNVVCAFVRGRFRVLERREPGRPSA